MNLKFPLSGPILTIHVDDIHSRTMLYDLVGDRYQLMGIATTATTLRTSGWDLNFGVRLALEELQAVTGRILLDVHKGLIQPVSRDGKGINHCHLTIAFNPPTKIFIVGLSKDPLLQYALRAVKMSGPHDLTTRYLDRISNPANLIDDVLTILPDIVIMVVGSEQIDRFTEQNLELLQLLLSQVPEEIRPEILCFDKPDTGLDQILFKVYGRKIPGLSDLVKITKANVWTEPAAFLELALFLNRPDSNHKSMLGISLNTMNANIVAASEGKVAIETISPTRAAHYPVHEFNLTFVESIHSWLGVSEITADQILDYIANKMLYPASLPLTASDVAIEYAWARVTLQELKNKMLEDLPSELHTQDGLIQNVEPILLTGAFPLNHANPAHTCLMALDGLQPLGITTLLIDPENQAVSIGTIAEINSNIATQLIDAGSFTHLATLISLAGKASPGTPVLRVKAIFDDGHEMNLDVKQGDLQSIPVPPGRTARLHLQPFHRYNVGLGGAGRGGELGVDGSILGVVIDGRGRPVQVPANPIRRNELFRKWLWMLGS
jgi:hypothetical protein